MEQAGEKHLSTFRKVLKNPYTPVNSFFIIIRILLSLLYPCYKRYNVYELPFNYNLRIYYHFNKNSFYEES